MTDLLFLKKKIVEMALSGKLTYNLDKDSNKQVMLNRIKQEYDRLNNGKKKKEFPEPDETELIEIPKRWQWVLLNDVGIYKKGPFGSALTKDLFVSKDAGVVKVYEQQNAIKKDYKLGHYYITQDYYEKKMKSFKVEPGDIIVSCAGTIGETYVLPHNAPIGIINQALMKVKIVPSVNVDFFIMYFDFYLKQNAINNGKGVAIINIPPFEILKQWPFPLPSYEEQERIVKKTKELFEIVDEMGLSLKKYSQDLSTLKTKTLEDAIKGKLTTQNESDSNVNELINNISTKDKKYKEIMNEEIPFEIPKNWGWMRLREFSEICSGGTPNRGVAEYWNGNIPWLKIGDIKGTYINEASEFITKKGMENSSAKWIEPNTILYTIFASIGTVGILSIRATTNQAIAAIKVNEHLNMKYIYYALVAQKSINLEKSKGNTQSNINQEVLKNTVIPIPPIEEQQRIVNILDEVLPLCDQLMEE